MIEQVLKKPKVQILITLFDDRSLEVSAPVDFLLFRDMMCAAERVLVDQIAQQRRAQRETGGKC